MDTQDKQKNLEEYLFIRPLLRRLEDGEFFCRATAVTLRGPR